MTLFLGLSLVSTISLRIALHRLIAHKSDAITFFLAGLATFILASARLMQLASGWGIAP